MDQSPNVNVQRFEHRISLKQECGPSSSLPFISETGCWLDPDNPEIKQEAQVLNENIWAEHHPKSLEDQPPKCLVLSVKQENYESVLLNGSENLSREDHDEESPLQNNSKEVKESSNVLGIKEETQLLDEDVWTDGHQKSLEGQLLKCLVWSVKQEKNDALLNGSENLSFEDDGESSLQNNSKEEKKSNASFEHGKKPQPLTSQPGCWLDNVLETEEETQLLDEDVWTDFHQKSLEDQPLKCLVLSVKQENDENVLLNGSEDLSLEDHEGESSLQNNSKEEIKSNTIFEHGNKPQPWTSHPGTRPYKRKLCAKEFITKAYVHEHERIHSGIRPYKCKVCVKAFFSKTYLNEHERIHSGIRPYKCKMCTKAFTTKKCLNNHEQIHSGIRPYKCKICAKAFFSKTYLNEHERTHSGTRLYKCELCEKTFITKAHLHKHERLHLGTRPYKCEICSKTFTQNPYIIHSGIKSN